MECLSRYGCHRRNWLRGQCGHWFGSRSVRRCQLSSDGPYELRRESDSRVMYELSDIAVIASARGRFKNKALVVCDGNGLPAKLFSRGILQGDKRLDRQVRRHPIIDIVSPEFEVRALERDHDFLIGLDLCGDSTDDGDGREIFGGRVNHHRLDLFPHVELVGAIAPIDVLHRKIAEGGIEGQFHGVGQTRPQVRQGGSVKNRRDLLAP